jgi:predicted dehydrogenase
LALEDILFVIYIHAFSMHLLIWWQFAKMLDREKPDAVFIVTAYHPDGRVQAADLALDVLKAGAHVWMEKPMAASVTEIRQLMAASKKDDRIVMTGLKKVFFPSIHLRNGRISRK